MADNKANEPKKPIINYTWNDKKRFCGMPITFTKYALSDDRLFVSVGLINEEHNETLLYRVKDITFNRNLWQKIFGVGTIVLNTNDTSTPRIEIKNIKNVEETKEQIHKAVEQSKKNKQMGVTELY